MTGTLAHEAASGRLPGHARARLRLAARLSAAGIADARIIGAMTQVPRHLFVDEALATHAYDDASLPIGNGQTISQPYIVALMTTLLGAGAGSRVLEIGTGCGYQTAILAALGAQVFSLEVVQPLAESAAQRLAALGYGNADIRHGDGYRGWPEQAPFDAILVTAAAPQVPMTLVRQLRAGGNLVIPVARGARQVLSVLQRGADGGLQRRDVLPVAFVPMVRG